MSNELVIRGGTVVDGTGAPGVRADVAVVGGRITEVGTGLTGDRVLDAADHVVTPGFIDIHTHYDAQVFWDPALTPSSWHGVTTVVAGNCGFSIAPCRPEHRELLARTLEHVEDMSLATLAAGIPWDFETFPEYLDSVRRRGSVINYAVYIGHTALRLYAMGDDGYTRERATDDELARMAALVREAVAAGAAGFSSSSSPTHSGDGGRPVPSRLANARELETVVAPMGELGRGVIALLPGERITHDDVFRVQRQTGRPLTWTALLTIKGIPYHEAVAERNATERAAGAEVWPQVSCRPLMFQMNMIEPFPFQMAPSFGALMGASRDDKVRAYRDPSWRARALHELEHEIVLRPRWPTYSVAESETRPDLIGKPLDAVAADGEVTPLDVMLDVALDEELRTRFASTLANDDEDGIAWLLGQEGMLIGLSDAGAHVSQLCDACMPTDLLGRWSREKEVLTLEAAVHKLTGEPAAVFGFSDRGRVAPGAVADLTVFDPATVAPGPLRRVRDFPADGERLVADAPVGVTHVVVNGTPIRVDDEPVEAALAARPGRVLPD